MSTKIKPDTIDSLQNDFGCVVRYVKHEYYKDFTDCTFLADKSDTSAEHDRTKNYDNKCGLCWLGQPHTVNAHNVEVSK